MDDTEDLDALVRRVDPDRWLAARFVTDPARRGELIALAALNHELARVAETVRTPMMGEIRLAWWREGLEGLAAGDPPRAQPVLKALQAAMAAGRIPLSLTQAMVDARHADLEPAPFSDEAALVGYIDRTAGALMAASAKALDGRAEPAAISGAARAWGWAGLLRAAPAWAARGRSWKPAGWAEATEAEIAAHVAHRVQASLNEARDELKALPVAAFPAVAYATLSQPYLRRPELSELSKQARLLRAVLAGRI